LDTGVVLGVGIRLVIFAAAVYVASQMRLGRNWARFVLTVGLRAIGMLSIVVGPISWHSVGEFLADAGLMSSFFALSRVVHLIALLTELVFMFWPAANDYFRTAAR
jgi:hypothetical protein